MGIEVRGSESLRQLRSRSDWPQSPKWENGRYSSVPRNALAHAAVTVLRPSNSEFDVSGARLRWIAFLPLDDDPEPRSSAIVESEAPAAGQARGSAYRESATIQLRDDAGGKNRLGLFQICEEIVEVAKSAILSEDARASAGTTLPVRTRRRSHG